MGCTYSEFPPLPQVEILGAKDSLMGSKIIGQSKLKLDPAQTLQSLLGDHPVLKMANNYIEPYLMTKSIVHPPLMYARWKDWDGQPLSEKPLFYQVKRQASIVGGGWGGVGGCPGGGGGGVCADKDSFPFFVCFCFV